MLIEPFRTEDIPGFLELAEAEGWLSDPWEFCHLLTAFPCGCFIARDRSGGPAGGYVTALRHERSGWIGNLIVRPERRGEGVGQALFLRALNALRAAGTETVWLTASRMGKSLYEKHGFSRIDTISRWSGNAGQRQVDHKPAAGGADIAAVVGAMDHRAWGDRRDGLLEAVVGRGELIVSGSGFLVVQPCRAAAQFGPFAAQDCSAAERLLNAALRSLSPGTAYCLDTPDLNGPALELFAAKGLRITGSNELMYSGVKPDYRPEMIYGLATMGSCG